MKNVSSITIQKVVNGFIVHPPFNHGSGLYQDPLAVYNKMEDLQEDLPKFFEEPKPMEVVAKAP